MLKRVRAKEWRRVKYWIKKFDAWNLACLNLSRSAHSVSCPSLLSRTYCLIEYLSKQKRRKDLSSCMQKSRVSKALKEYDPSARMQKFSLHRIRSRDSSMKRNCSHNCTNTQKMAKNRSIRALPAATKYLLACWKLWSEMFSSSLISLRSSNH